MLTFIAYLFPNTILRRQSRFKSTQLVDNYDLIVNVCQQAAYQLRRTFFANNSSQAKINLWESKASSSDSWGFICRWEIVVILAATSAISSWSQKQMAEVEIAASSMRW